MNLKNGKELIISNAAVEDAENLIEYYKIVGGESDNLLLIKDKYHMSVEEYRKFLEDKARSDTSALLVGRIEGEIACVGNITSPTRERIAHQCEIGITVKKKLEHRYCFYINA